MLLGWPWIWPQSDQGWTERFGVGQKFPIFPVVEHSRPRIENFGGSWYGLRAEQYFPITMQLLKCWDGPVWLGWIPGFLGFLGFFRIFLGFLGFFNPGIQPMYDMFVKIHYGCFFKLQTRKSWWKIGYSTSPYNAIRLWDCGLKIHSQDAPSF